MGSIEKVGKKVYKGAEKVFKATSGIYRVYKAGQTVGWQAKALKDGNWKKAVEMPFRERGSFGAHDPLYKYVGQKLGDKWVTDAKKKHKREAAEAEHDAKYNVAAAKKNAEFKDERVSLGIKDNTKKAVSATAGASSSYLLG